jgi:hypothetical protein
LNVDPRRRYVISFTAAKGSENDPRLLEFLHSFRLGAEPARASRDDPGPAPKVTTRPDAASSGSSAALPAEAPLPEPRPARMPEAAAAKPAPASGERDKQVRADYELTERVGSVQAWDAFLVRYPSGFYAELARQQRAKLAARAPNAPPSAPREPAAKPAPAKSAPAAKSASSAGQNTPKREQQFFCSQGQGCQPVPPNCHVTRGYLAGQQGALSHTDQLVCR